MKMIATELYYFTPPSDVYVAGIRPQDYCAWVQEPDGMNVPLLSLDIKREMLEFSPVDAFRNMQPGGWTVRMELLDRLIYEGPMTVTLHQVEGSLSW